MSALNMCRYIAYNMGEAKTAEVCFCQSKSRNYFGYPFFYHVVVGHVLSYVVIFDIVHDAETQCCLYLHPSRLKYE